MTMMTFEEYFDSSTEGGEPLAGYWNRVIDFAYQNFESGFQRNGEPMFTVDEWRAAEEMAEEWLNT